MKLTQRGLTLLEVIISVAILAFISVFVAMSIQRGLRARAKIQQDIDRSVALREAVNLISRDIQLAFNYRDINTQLYNAAVRERCKKPSPTASPTPAGGTGGASGSGSGGGTTSPSPTPTGLSDEQCQEKEEKIVTQFIGESDKLDFTALSHVRLRKDDPTSDQAEIGYFLRNCKSRFKNQQGGQCLWRRISPIIDDDVTQGGQETVLLENVKELTFRYLGEGTDGEWQKVWSSDGKSDTTKAGKFPLAVEVTLQVYDTRFQPPKEVGMTVVAPLRFPNNPTQSSQQNQEAGGAPTPTL